MNRNYDRILLEGMIFEGFVGVHDFEKKNGQPFQIDMEIVCPRLAACDTDQLDQTIDYGKAYELTGNIVRSAACDLIERLAGMIAVAILDSFPLAAAVDVTVRKPQAPITGQFSAMGIRIYRERT